SRLARRSAFAEEQARCVDHRRTTKADERIRKAFVNEALTKALSSSQTSDAALGSSRFGLFLGQLNQVAEARLMTRSAVAVNGLGGGSAVELLGSQTELGRGSFQIASGNRFADLLHLGLHSRLHGAIASATHFVLTQTLLGAF